MNIEQFENDWRNMGQLDYLKNEKVAYLKYMAKNPFDHEHCIFCYDTISVHDNDLHYAYNTQNNRYWICEKCFNDFKDIFNWKIVSEDSY